MPDYSKGKIYTIRNKDDNTKIYVGSTTQFLIIRFKEHKRKSKQINSILYKEVNNDWTNWYIELYENYSCSSKKELLKKEGEIIRLIGTLNKVVQGRTKKEYKEDNIEKIKEYHKYYRNEKADKLKEWRDENIDKRKEYDKQYYIDNADIKKEYRKQYYIDNADKIKEKGKQYRIDNADKIKERKKQYYLKKKNEKLSI